MAGRRRAVGRLIAFGIVTGFVILALLVVDRIVHRPQTDDAVVTADVIGVVPQVSGTITELHVQDNQRVKEGDLLPVVEPRPYELAVKRARAAVAPLAAALAVPASPIEGQRHASGVARA